ncbi:MAG: cysteine synthase, partial [Marinirhabdus sp.]|nr:cysteine synthase [Marinirhabdus sp.]
ALYEHAELMVGYGSFKEEEFVRLVTINSGNETEDVENFFSTLETFVSENESLFSSSLKTESA